MKPFIAVTGRTIPLDRANVDTDQIIPAEYLKGLERTGYGRHAFEAWRKDPKFVLNDSNYRDAPFMAAGPNFGCGSSREHAPWALLDLGLRAILAPSFADIFAGNCASVGLLAIRLPEKECDTLMTLSREDPTAEITVDLPAQTVATSCGRFNTTFHVDPFVKRCLVQGLDPIGLTLAMSDRIDSYELSRHGFKPRTTRRRKGEKR